jgi:hypothetical protein
VFGEWTPPYLHLKVGNFFIRTTDKNFQDKPLQDVLNFNPKATDELCIFRLGDLTDVSLELKHPSNEQSGFKNYSSYQPKNVKIIDNLSAKIQVRREVCSNLDFRKKDCTWKETLQQH